MKNEITKSITRNAVVAAIYFVLTVAGSSFSFGIFQIRIAEALVLLCFFRRDYTYGLTIGCLLSNLFSPIFPWDLLIGTAATLVSCLAVSFCKQLFVSALIPVVVNGFAVGGELAILSKAVFWPTVGFVAAGEFIAVAIIGYLFFFLNKKNKVLFDVIGANINLEFKW